MPDEMTGTDTSVAAPAAPDQGTQPQADPAGAPANADGAGSPAAQTQTQEPASAPKTPIGELMAAAEGQQQQQQQQAQLLAGKFKTPQDLEKGYLEAQKFISRSAQRQKEVEEQLRQIQAAAQGRQQQEQEGAKDPWMEKWEADPMFGPLAKMPDSRYSPQEHAEWVENVFKPRFVSNPTETINYVSAPQVRAGYVQVYRDIMAEIEKRDKKRAVESYFDSREEFLGGKSVGDFFAEAGMEAADAFGDILREIVPEGKEPTPAQIRFAVKHLSMERSQKPLQAASAAAQAKDQDLLKLASGAPNRGAPASVDQGLVGEGETFAEKMVNSLKNQGTPLDREPVMHRDPFKRSTKKG